MYRTSERGLIALARKDACVLSTYMDSVGVKTILIGRGRRAHPEAGHEGDD
jgi:GH24 family phage-related lysozyme (muramidase)